MPTAAPPLSMSLGLQATRVRMVPVRLTSTTCAKTSGSCSSMRRIRPAQVTTASIRGQSATTASSWAWSVTSASTKRMPGCASTWSALKPIAVTVAPAAAKPRDRPRPMPLVPPVITAWRPA